MHLFHDELPPPFTVRIDCAALALAIARRRLEVRRTGERLIAAC
jgi:hypothetical protein